MSFELALGLWTVVTVLATVSALVLIVVLAPELADRWRILAGGRNR